MGMRKEFLVGLALIVTGYLLDPYKHLFPEWGEALFNFVWAPLPVPRAVAAIVAFAIGFLVFDYWATSRAAYFGECDRSFRRIVTGGLSDVLSAVSVT